MVDCCATVWSSAEKLGAKRMPGYVTRLRVRNRAARDRLARPFYCDLPGDTRGGLQ